VAVCGFIGWRALANERIYRRHCMIAVVPNSRFRTKIHFVSERKTEEYILTSINSNFTV
jgi:hypothetical protein